MAGKIYTINKGINKPVEFKGVKAQYIWHLAGAVIGSLALFGILYVIGLSIYICLPLVFGAGGWTIRRVFRMSKKYGQFGLMKLSARKSAPKALLSRSRKVFLELFSSSPGRKHPTDGAYAD